MDDKQIAEEMQRFREWKLKEGEYEQKAAAAEQKWREQMLKLRGDTKRNLSKRNLSKERMLILIGLPSRNK